MNDYELGGENAEECVGYEKLIKVQCLAAAYIPIQELCRIYNPEEALSRGTLFPDLYMPYKGRKGGAGYE